MGCFMKANKVSGYNMRILWVNVRIPFVLIIVMLYVMERLSAVLTFSRAMQIDATPFAFVFLVNNYRIQFVIAASAVILFCNAPFEDESQSGKTVMGTGADSLYFKNVGSLYRQSGNCVDDSFPWAYYMVRRMGQDLGDTGENKCRSGFWREIVSFPEYYTKI